MKLDTILTSQETIESAAWLHSYPVRFGAGQG